MSPRARALTATLSAFALAWAVIGVANVTQAATDVSGPVDSVAAATDRLTADGRGTIGLTRDDRGQVSFLGTRAGAEVVNPTVRSSSSVSAAARAHLSRYGAALGLARAGTTLVQRQVRHTVAGTDAVTYTQQVGGLPVIGGDVVVTIGADRQLTSIQSTVSLASVATEAKVSESAAERTARVVASRNGMSGDFDVVSAGRWVFDPAVLGVSTGVARTVHRFEATNGGDQKRLVLIDDQTGALVLTFDDVKHLDRVVCDNSNARRSADVACTSGFARTETSVASSVNDVNQAFDYSGETATFYQQIGGIDLTNLLGVTVGDQKKLASTVNWCYTTGNCPYANAFWNGTQMFYGQGFTSGDDVVGHEMTHGVTDHYSELFYWGQSGAINESMSDVMGEIIDHRNGNDDDSGWLTGEDLPVIGALRSLKDPTLFGDPDSMTSASYTADTADYSDSGGVHTNSGVGNKTAYLISQGGTFGGQTITGIDAGDPLLTKTATLYLYAIQTLASGSDYADLADTLDQGCSSLIGTAGLTTADCAEVAKATVATRLRTTPTQAPQPADAPATCPDGTTKRVLADSESGTPATVFTAGANWRRGSSDYWGSNATSGQDSWYNASSSATTAETPSRRSLVWATPVALPASQPSYLWFQSWHLLDYYNTSYYDGGTVEVTDTAVGTAQPTADLPWVNGPDRTIATGTQNPIAGQRAFAGDSLGWVARRLDLSSFAGKNVRPQFTLNTDNRNPSPGWWLDDITVYTCDTPVVTAPPGSSPAPVAAMVPGSLTPAPVKIVGKVKVGKRLTAVTGTWAPAGVTFAYQWLRNGKDIRGATSSTYKATGKDSGKKISVRVIGITTGVTPVGVTSPAVKVKVAKR